MARTPRVGRRAIAVVVVALVAAAIVGGVVAQRPPTPADVDSLEAAIEKGRMTKVADVPGAEGEARRGVFVQELDLGYLCVWDAPSASSRARQGGCNPLDAPLGGTAISANLAYDGGPAVEAVREARLTGLARSDATRLVVLMSDGSARSIPLRRAALRSGDFVAFGYRFRTSDLQKGIGPIAVVAYDAHGAELGRQPTGIG